MSTINPIHASVRARYGAIADTRGVNAPLTIIETASALSCSADGTCCAPASEQDSGCTPTSLSDATRLYDSAALDSLPVDVTGLSLGCGDPVSMAGIREGETVLDLGSGGGIDCFLAAQRVGPSGQVIGVDMTPAMLERANASKAKMGVTNVEFREGQIEALPVANASIDLIISNCVINLAPDKAAVFREAYRVLKPGGRLSVSDIVAEGAFSAAMRADLSQWAECVTGAVEADDYRALLTAAGFTQIALHDKRDTADIIPTQDGMPRLISARITAVKP